MSLLMTGGPACQSCGAPMMSTKDRGGGRADNPYCRHCTDHAGELLPFAQVLENMAVERFMKVNGMPRKGAEDAARRALEAMPLWRAR
jgi:hypothetical protein